MTAVARPLHPDRRGPLRRALWPFPRPISRKITVPVLVMHSENLQEFPARYAYYGSGHDQFRPIGVLQALRILRLAYTPRVLAKGFGIQIRCSPVRSSRS